MYYVLNCIMFTRGAELKPVLSRQDVKKVTFAQY